jgi:hypothetical protein
LNAIADAEMVAAFEASASPSLEALMMFRFVKNAHLKGGVRALALSDTWYPVDAIRRTLRTARTMQALRRQSGSVRCAIIVVGYTCAVAVWLFDSSNDIRWTRGTVRALTFILGQR